jgi:hypothetical protein
LVLHFIWPKTSGSFKNYCKFEAIQIYAILFANKTFSEFKLEKEKSFQKKGEKGRGRCFGLVAEASPAR